MKKIMCIILALTFFVNCNSALANDIKFPCTYDMYTEGVGIQMGIIYENNGILLIGDVYEREAKLSFDIQNYDVDAGGYILSLTIRNNSVGSEIMLYADDGETLIGSSKLEKTGRIKCEFVVSKYIKNLIESQIKSADFILRTNADAITVFSSENSNVNYRPYIRVTEGEAYVPGQKDFTYPTVSKEEFASRLKTTVAGGHPYLFGRKSDFERVKKALSDNDANVTKWYEQTKQTALLYIDKEPASINPANSYLSRGEEGKNIVMNCAFVYLIEGDERFAQRAYSEAELFANLSTWGTYQYIDNNQLALAVAYCYDWLYDWMSAEQRKTLSDGLRKNHLDTLLDLYRNPTSSKYTAGFYQTNFSYENHAFLDNCATFVEALAISDIDAQYSAEIMHNTLKNLERCFDKIYPDGAWFEGLNYWNYVGPYMARVLNAMESAFGEYFGYENISCIVNLADYAIYGKSSQGNFVFNDASQAEVDAPEIFYFGKVKADINQQIRYLKEEHPTTGTTPLLCLWYNPDDDYTQTVSELPYDKFFRNCDMVTMRSDFSSNQETYVAMLVQKAAVPHGAINSGTFTFDALGERWVTNPGKDSYSLTGYWDIAQTGKRWKYYNMRAEANSCLVINPSSHGGQNVNSDDTIDTYVSKEKGAFAYADLTDTYKDFVSSYKRGVSLTDNRTKFVIQDEVKLLEPSEVYSFINVYMSDIEITQDGKAAILTKGNKHVYVNVEADKPYTLEVLRADGLPTSDLLPGGMYIKDIKRIGIHFDNVDSLNCKIELIPYLTETEFSHKINSEITPLADWDIEDGSCSVPVLDTIIADGKELEFNPSERCIRIADDETLPSKIEAFANDCNVKVESNTDLQKHEITVTDNAGNINTYIVYKDIVKEAEVIDVSNLTRLAISKATASVDDGNVPANVIDGKLETRWSANGKQYLDLTLAQEATLSCIGIAFYSGTQRRAYFELFVSLDGKNWKSAGEFESSGTTDDFEYFSLNDSKAKYVRIYGYGNNTSTWNSIVETSLYTK